jgi:hypothetical protein
MKLISISIPCKASSSLLQEERQTMTRSEKIDNAFPIFSYEEVCVETISFQRWQSYGYQQLRTNMLQFLKTECPELGDDGRQIVADEKLFPLRERIIRAESLFRLEREIEASATAAYLRLNPETPTNKHIARYKIEPPCGIHSAPKSILYRL